MLTTVLRWRDVANYASKGRSIGLGYVSSSGIAMDQVVATLLLDLFTHAGCHEVGAEANTAWDGLSSYR